MTPRPALTSRRELMVSALALGLAAQTRAFARTGGPRLQTRSGRVSGVTQPDGIHRFLGIRYGRDTRLTRFQPPQQPYPWRDVLPARAYGAACPQRSAEPSQSEDCLFINVWTPGLGDEAGRPVMVYFHGGAYATGSGSSPLYDGSRLAAEGDCIVITVNHRLNAFGYLSLKRIWGSPFAYSGNAGQLDLILALQWVRDHALALGGDPDRIMVFGQSGGGAKIASLMATPLAAGLFHTAATMSGQQVTASGPLNADARSRAYLSALGTGGASPDALLQLPAERLVEALQTPDPVLPYGRVYFGPVLDDTVLHRHPFYPDAAPQSLHIPMIIGNTRDETRAFLRGERYENLTWEALPALLESNMRVDIAPERVLSQYRAWYPQWSPEAVFYAATTAGRSWRGAVIEAEERARAGAPAFAYQLDWGNPFAPHTFDIPLVFGTLSAEGSQTGTGVEAEQVSQFMRQAFVGLAKHGQPSHAGLPDWPGYTLESRETMIFDIPPRLALDPRGRERELFSTVPYVQPGT